MPTAEKPQGRFDADAPSTHPFPEVPMYKLVMVSCLVSGQRQTAFIRLQVDADGKVRLPATAFAAVFDPPAASTVCVGY